MIRGSRSWGPFLPAGGSHGSIDLRFLGISSLRGKKERILGLHKCLIPAQNKPIVLFAYGKTNLIRIFVLCYETRVPLALFECVILNAHR